MAGDHVFGYGSLAAQPGAVPCVLHDHRRHWGVAMDNAQAIPGYKRYRDRDGYPDVCVAFLDLEPAAGTVVHGICLPAVDLAALDARERNYVRVDVTELVDGGSPGRVWAYAGRDDSRERLRRARAAGRAVVARAYAQAVERAFADLGLLAAYRASTVPHGLPVLDLERVELPQLGVAGGRIA
ncbi:MAG: hypothetical protein QOE86_1497 [Solirubrobacteraceae bacterium]|jgi:hypothetical protein|nr:hypothetical protein [Solirubrobacteraceae bacterium]